jgi:putative nucleotidyltransferase with HDIG domain
VASGGFEVGRSQPRLLQAFLGTCVGVAIVDDTAGVGGLLHILLPEPVSSAGVDQPEKYATTAMPLFLNQLLDAGATRENMEAIVAGGALVGPLTLQDINLDIGGRTVEKVTDILRAENITLSRSETGGFFSCCLELDMQRWDCRILPAGWEAKGTDSLEPPPTNSKIRQAIESINPIPQVALKVLRIIEDGSYDISKIAAEVKKDQVISARTIQLCNSAMFAKPQKVVSLDHALVFLGQEMFVKQVISAAVERYYDQCGNGYSLCKGGLYHHAIGTAMVAEKIAGLTEKVVPAIAYTAGLLHDIGKVVLDQYIAGVYPLLYREFQDRQSEILEVENKILGMDHTCIGEMLATNWSLPGALTGAIRYHHQPDESDDNRDLITIVYLADLLLSRFHPGLEMERMGTEHLIDNLSRLGLSTGQFSGLVDLIPKKVFQTFIEPM